MKIVREIRNRWKSETPLFWKKIRDIGVVLTAIGGVCLSANGLDESITTIGGYLTLSGGIIAALSQLTVKGNDEQR